MKSCAPALYPLFQRNVQPPSNRLGKASRPSVQQSPGSCNAWKVRIDVNLRKAKVVCSTMPTLCYPYQICLSQGLQICSSFTLFVCLSLQGEQASRRRVQRCDGREARGRDLFSSSTRPCAPNQHVPRGMHRPRGMRGGAPPSLPFRRDIRAGRAGAPVSGCPTGAALSLV